MPQLYTRIKNLSWDRRRIVDKYPPPKDTLHLLKNEYQYPLPQIRRQDDPVLRTMCEAIDELSKEHMLFAATSITVRNLTLSPVIWPSTRENIGWSSKLYTFKERLEEFPLTVRVSITERDFDLLLTADMIRVLIRGEWKPLKTWLLELVQEDGRFPWNFIHNRPHYVQQTWWRKNGKVFRLMDLPQEIRLIILKHALGGFIHPAAAYNHSSREYQVTLGCTSRNNPDKMNYEHSESNRDSMQAKKKFSSPNYALFRVNKQVHGEALIAGWQGSRKHFVTPGYLIDVLGATQVPVISNWLSKIQLNFSTEDYFRFIGLSVNPDLHLNSFSSMGLHLSNIATLEDLELHFRSPYNTHHDDKNGDPWSTWRRQLSYHVTPIVSREYGCYKTIVDWILAFMLPYVKNISKLRFTGAIKTSVKDKWVYIHSIEYCERELDYRSHGYDVDAELAAILALSPSFFPPTCSCPQSCLPYSCQDNLFDFDHDDAYEPGSCTCRDTSGPQW